MALLTNCLRKIGPKNCMNQAQKTGTLFVSKKGIIVLPEAANKPQQSLANQLPCNAYVQGPQQLKSKF